MEATVIKPNEGNDHQRRVTAGDIKATLKCHIKHARALLQSEAFETFADFYEWIDERTTLGADSYSDQMFDEKEQLLLDTEAAPILERKEKTVNVWGRDGLMSRVDIALRRGRGTFRFLLSDVRRRKAQLDKEKEDRQRRTLRKRGRNNPPTEP
jgi:hypothetical protein